MATGPLPRGTLTFLFTDIEGSTKLLNALGTDRYHEVLEVHTETLRPAFAAGHEVRMEGDALFMVFATARDALAAAAEAQRALAKATFPHGAVIRVRMGMHTGEGTPASEKAGADYVGIDVHRAARIAAIAHGGQVLISGATRVLAGDDLPDGVQLRDLGDHRLKDLAQPERVFQLVIDGCPSDFPALRTLDRIPNNLPQQITTFIGREKEIRDGLKLLDRTRLLTLTGPGGTGKTRLSLQLAAEAGDQFADGAFWVALAPISDAELVPSTIAHSLGVQVTGSELPMDRVTEHLRDKTLLLVLDNFEQILPAASTISTLLGAAPGLKVVTSSRAPLRISGEQELPVPPLDLPDPDRLPSLEALAQSDAVRLFIERARAVKPDFMVTPENAAAVAGIVFHLDGLPLAIELAAARVKLLTPQAMLPRLRQGLDLLASTARDRTDRQRTLRGAIAWSYDLLDDGMKRLFARCAVFVAGAELEELEAVCGPAADIGRDVLDGVSELVDQSLLRQNDVAGTSRFRMLVTIRDYALEMLAVTGEEPELRARHLAAYTALAERAQPELQGPSQKQWLDRLERDHDNLRAALEFAIARSDADSAGRIVYSLWRFWQVRGYLREGRRWAERVRGLPGGTPLRRLRTLEALGGLVYWTGDAKMADVYEAALALAREIGDPKEIALAAYNLSFAFTVPGTDMSHGRELLEEALAIFRELGDGAAIGRTSFALSNVLSYGSGHPREDLLRAREVVGEALEQHRKLSNQFDLVWDLHMTGLVELKLGNAEAARRAWTEASELLLAAGDTSGLVLMLSNFAELAKAAGDIERHDVLVGAWGALARATGVGLTAVFGQTEDRAQPESIPAERQGAVQRGAAMTLEIVMAYALGREPATTA